MPFFSLCIPTRDRPELLKAAISSMLAQNFKDFEIIVSDNAIKKPCEDIVKSFNDDRIKYIRADKPLGLNENWERALSYATGEYQGIFIDKILLQPDCLSSCHDVIINNEDIDIISWPRDVYYPSTDDVEGPGKYYPSVKITSPCFFLPYAEWQRRLSFHTVRDGKKDYFHRGKIVFGLYSKHLIEKIRSKHSHIFPAFFPDYTSLSFALAYARRGYDFMRPMILGIQPKESTGISLNEQKGFLEKYLRGFENHETLIQTLPYPELLMSQHNVTARDYLLALNDSEVSAPELNKINLESCISFDIEKSPFSETEKLDLKRHLSIDAIKDMSETYKPNTIFYVISTIAALFLKLVFRINANLLKIEILSWPNPNKSVENIDKYNTSESALKAQHEFYNKKYKAKLHNIAYKLFRIYRKTF